MKKIKIELIHDVVCSWCPIAYRNIKSAIKPIDSQIDIDFRFLPFELNSEMPVQGELINDYLQRKNGWTRQQLMSYRENLIEIAAAAGLNYDFSKRTHYWNSATAHALIHVAEKFHKQEEVNQALIFRYFTLGQNISDIRVLCDVADSVGLNSNTIISDLSSTQTKIELNKKYGLVRRYAISSVPTIVVNDQDLISGSNSVDYFSQFFSAYLRRAA